MKNHPGFLGAGRVRPTLFMVTGKGGFGKSTVAAAMGLAAKRRGMRVLVAEMDTNAVIPSLLLDGREAPRLVPGEPLELEPGLGVVNLDHQSSIICYLEEHLPVPRLIRAVVGNPVVSTFLEAAPAVTQMALLNRVFVLVRDMRAGKIPYDVLVLDMPALGHAYQLIKAPVILADFLKMGPAARRSRDVRDMLLDPEVTSLVLVTLPEEMPVNETAQFGQRIAGELGMAIEHVLVNQVAHGLTDDHGPGLPDLLGELAKVGTERLGKLLELGAMWERRAARARELTARLVQELPSAKIHQLPLMADRGRDLVEAVARRLSAEEAT